MFLHLSVILFTGGACVVGGGVMHGREVCIAGGACVAGGSMCGRGHAAKMHCNSFIYFNLGTAGFGR